MPYRSLSRTAADSAWNFILNKPDSSYSFKLRSMIDSEESFDLHLGPLHRIVLGLSRASLEDQIEMRPTGIRDVDWLGRSPLMWAAYKGDSKSLKILLSRGAAVNHSCRFGETPLHGAASIGSVECMKLLLE